LKTLWIMLKKEIRWNWRSFRYPAFFLLLTFFALSNPPLMKYMDQLLELFAEGVEIGMGPPSPGEVFSSYLVDVSQIGILVLIFISSQGGMVREKENGVAGWILSKPVARWKYFAAKAISLNAMTIISFLAASMLSYLYTWSLFESFSFSRAFTATISLTVFAMFYSSLSLTFATLLKSPLQAGGITVAVFFLGALFSLPLQEIEAGRFYPHNLAGEIPELLAGTSTWGDILPALVLALVLRFLFLLIAGYRFQRMEI